MDAESDVAITTFLSYLLTDSVDFADIWLRILGDKVLYVNFERIHLFLNLLLRLMLLSLYYIINAANLLLINRPVFIRHH